MDFTPHTYEQLLAALLRHERWTLRHDVDTHAERSLTIAKLEKGRNVQSTYYFRQRDIDRQAATIVSIHDLGHRIGYHYENLDACGGDMRRAYDDFCRNLERLRRLAPVSTACAHGSPRSRWNNQDLWNQYDIHRLGIDYEPMLDTDFGRTLYLTDTGRRWDGASVSVRDKVQAHQQRWRDEGLRFHSTDDIIHALNDMDHPIHRHDLLVNTHPQRWITPGAAWVAEAGLQWGKNVAKHLIVKYNNRKQ